MLRLIILLVLTTSAYANGPLEHLIIKKYPPGSIRIEYGGPRAAFYNGASKYLEDIWKDSVYLKHRNDIIDDSEYFSQLRKINNEILDHKNGGKWWQREWTYSFTEINGGAPKPQTLQVGRTFIFADFYLFYFTTEFKFKIRELKASIDFNNPTPLSVSYLESRTFSGNGWKFRISPKIKLSLIDRPNSLLDFIRSVCIGLSGAYFYRGKNILNISIGILYLPRRKDAQLLLILELPLWRAS